MLVATSSYAMTTSTVVVGSSGGCLVIDPAVTTADLAGLAAELAARGLRPAVGWSTHPHWDHVLWSRELGDAPRYAAPAAITIAEAQRDDIVDWVQRTVPGHDLSLVGRMRALDASAIPWDGPEARLIVHDGHAPGHGAVFCGERCPDRRPCAPTWRYRCSTPTRRTRSATTAPGWSGWRPPGVRRAPGHGHIGDAAELRRRLALTPPT